jgi:hypothetical protein
LIQLCLTLQQQSRCQTAASLLQMATPLLTQTL